jgi:hypothetical protein
VAVRTLNRQDQRTSLHPIVKTLNMQNKKRILKYAREKHQVTYKCKPIKIKADFSTETLKFKRCISNPKRNYQLYAVKLCFIT